MIYDYKIWTIYLVLRKRPISELWLGEIRRTKRKEVAQKYGENLVNEHLAEKRIEMGRVGKLNKHDIYIL